MSTKNFASYGNMNRLITEVGNKLGNKLDKGPTPWSTKTWSGLKSFDGCYIWTDGENIYYSYGSSQYVLDKTTSTWSTKTWSGTIRPYGDYIWTDGDNIYLSSSSNHYILDKSTSTWSAKTWSGLTSFDGHFIWTDGDNIYYSNGSSQYVLDKSTSTWSTKTWSGLTSFNGQSIWTDGENIYYSYGSSQYVLDKTTSTWSTKTWSGTIRLYGYYIWKDGDNIYHSFSSNQYVLDKATSTWSAKTWSGLTSFDGRYIWTDGENIYYSYGSSQYVLDKSALLRADGSKDITEYAKKSDVHNVPSGGSARQVLVKNSSTDYDAEWKYPTEPAIFNLAETNVHTVVGTSKTVHVSYYGGDYSLRSSNTSVATVSATTVSDDGNYHEIDIVITPVSNGACTIILSVTPDDGHEFFEGKAYINVTVGAASGSSIKKTRYTITASSWSASANSDGYYTYTQTLSPAVKSSPDVYVAGSTDSTQPTDAQRVQFGYVERCKVNSSTLTLYAKTKPTATFYIWVEGEEGTASGDIVGNVIQPNGAAIDGFTNVTTLHILNQEGPNNQDEWNPPSTETNGQYRNYFVYGTVSDVAKIRASKYIRVNVIRKYTATDSSNMEELWCTTLIDVATLKSIETAQNSRAVRAILPAPDLFYLYHVGNIFIYPFGTKSRDELLVQFAESTQLYDKGANYHVYDVVIDCI